MEGKLTFTVLSFDDIVGAIIDRPAVKCYHFADNCGESVLPAARALNERPYIRATILPDQQ